MQLPNLKLASKMLKWDILALKCRVRERMWYVLQDGRHLRKSPSRDGWTRPQLLRVIIYIGASSQRSGHSPHTWKIVSKRTYRLRIIRQYPYIRYTHGFL